MKRKGLILLGVLTLLLGNKTPVQAEDYQGEDGWRVRFLGDGLESNFKTADINDAIYNLQPGDSIAITVALENGGTRAADWWMTNKVLRSLEDTQEAAAGGGYSYTLIYENPEGDEQILYTSDTVGGEKNGEAGEGLKEATDSLEEYFFLDVLSAGERGYIYLTVSLDGETQGNAYQDTLADLQMNFAVEENAGAPIPVDDDQNPGGDGDGGGSGDTGGEGGNPSTEGGSSGSGRGTSRQPKTSDDAELFPYAALTFVSGIGLLVLALYSMRHSGEEKKGGAGK